MQFKILRTTIILFGAVLASAQNISTSCQQAFATVAASPDAACLNPNGLIPVFTQGPNTSVVPALNNWLTGMCSLTPCTNQSLANIVGIITAGCPAELTALGFGSVSSADVISAVQQIYPTIRKLLCFKNKSTGQYCDIETLTNIEKTTGPLTVDKLVTFLTDPEAIVTKLPKETICTDCIKASLIIISNELLDIHPEAAKDALCKLCGESFVDGKMPSGVSEI